MSPGNVLFSLQSRLMFAFAAVVLVALALAAGVFVFVRRGEQEQQQLDRVIAASPAIYGAFTVLQERGAPPQALAEFIDQAAEGFNVRILLVEREFVTVEADSEDDLTGERLVLPLDVLVTAPTRLRPYASWRPESGTPGHDLILVSALPSRRLPRSLSPENDRFWLLLAVPEGTIRGAWRGLLPALAVAAAIALPIAIALAVLISRYITRPLEELTVASQRMAEGVFDVHVSVDRRDEVGRLAQAFSGMAERVGEAQAQMRALVANVSHDLKTPLTSILGFAQALRDSDDNDADARRMGGVIHDEATRLNNRLSDLLFLSELESGQTLLQREEVNVLRLLEDVITRIEPDVASRVVDLRVDTADGLTVIADRTKLERALENLLDNARKYAPSGSEIRVRLSLEDDRARIAIANEAPDLSADEVPRLFQRFYRRERPGGGAPGSGLGLPIARDLIELNGGIVEASVSDGEVVFTISLPVAT